MNPQNPTPRPDTALELPAVHAAVAALPVGAPLPAADVPALAVQFAEIAIRLYALPFDVARAQYARAVEAGLLQRSMLASRDFARTLGALERLALGPWARHP
ncbi:MAG: hypothetical protein ACR2I0_10755 [Rhodoferax sp.]